jgi:hypothetical protein
MTTLKKPKPNAFNNIQANKIEVAMAKLYYTQFGALKDRFTTDDLKLLFVPPEYRAALSQVYQIESDYKATGTIMFDLVQEIGPIRLELVERSASAIIDKCHVKLWFNRASAPNGFITPERIFGRAGKPDAVLQLAPETLKQRFLENLTLLAKVCAEWALVKWTFMSLNKSLRSPEQMRYVWPATYPLTMAAEMDMDLSEPSARAGMNAVPASDIRAYLRDTNDIVARSALLGIDKGYMETYASNDLVITHQQIALNTATILHTQG